MRHPTVMVNFVATLITKTCFLFPKEKKDSGPELFRYKSPAGAYREFRVWVVEIYRKIPVLIQYVRHYIQAGQCKLCARDSE